MRFGYFREIALPQHKKPRISRLYIRLILGEVRISHFPARHYLENTHQHLQTKNFNTQLLLPRVQQERVAEYLNVAFCLHVIACRENQNQKRERRGHHKRNQCSERPDHRNATEVFKLNTSEDELQHKNAVEESGQKIEINPDHHHQFSRLENRGSPDEPGGINPLVGQNRSQWMQRSPAVPTEFYQGGIRLKAANTQLIFK